MAWQFQVDGRPAAPVRVHWVTAAQDAVSAGYAVWSGHNQIKTDEQAAVVHIATQEQERPDER